MSDKKILSHVHELMRRKHYSIGTEKSYINWMKRFYYFHKQMNPDEILGHQYIKTTMIYTHVMQKK